MARATASTAAREERLGSLTMREAIDDPGTRSTEKPRLSGWLGRCRVALREAPRQTEHGLGTDDPVDLEALMLAYIDGDESAFDALYGAIESPIRRTLRRWLREPARVDDALQVTLIKIHTNRHRFRRDAAVLPWVVTIARHVAVDSLRRDKNRPRSLDEELLRVLPAPDAPEWNEEDEREVIAAVRAAVDALPASARDVVRMHKLEGRSMAEVAEALGIKEGAARVRAHRGYKTLARRLLGFHQSRLED